MHKVTTPPETLDRVSVSDLSEFKKKTIRPGKKSSPGLIEKDQAIKALLRNDLTKLKEPIFLNLEQKIIVREVLYNKLQELQDAEQFSVEDKELSKSLLTLHYEEQISLIEDIIVQIYK